MSIPCKTKPNLIQKIEKALNDTLYKNSIKTSSTYNNRLIAERLSRLPFIDLQTGVAQNNCSLWMNRWERMPGYNQGQVYSYPSNQWHRSRRSYLLTGICPSNTNLEANVNVQNEVPSCGNDPNLLDCHVQSENGDFKGKFEVFKETVGSGEAEEATSDLCYLVEAEGVDSEEDEDLNTGHRKKRKKYAKRKKANEYTDAEKPYFCDFCGMKYKTRPGLAYHYSHSHPNASVDMTGGPRNSIGMDNTSEISTKSVIIPTQLHPGLAAQSSSDCQGQKSYSFNRETFFRDKVTSPTSSLTDQKSLANKCPTDRQSGFGLLPKYSAIGKSLTSINQDSDESASELSNLSSNCKNILWPLYDPLFSSA